MAIDWDDIEKRLRQAAGGAPVADSSSVSINPASFSRLSKIAVFGALPALGTVAFLNLSLLPMAVLFLVAIIGFGFTAAAGVRGFRAGGSPGVKFVGGGILTVGSTVGVFILYTPIAGIALLIFMIGWGAFIYGGAYDSAAAIMTGVLGMTVPILAVFTVLGIPTSMVGIVIAAIGVGLTRINNFGVHSAVTRMLMVLIVGTWAAAVANVVLTVLAGNAIGIGFAANIVTAVLGAVFVFDTSPGIEVPLKSGTTRHLHLVWAVRSLWRMLIELAESAQPTGGGFHVPRPVKIGVVLSIIGLAGEFFLPPGVVAMLYFFAALLLLPTTYYSYGAVIWDILKGLPAAPAPDMPPGADREMGKPGAWRWGPSEDPDMPPGQADRPVTGAPDDSRWKSTPARYKRARSLKQDMLEDIEEMVGGDWEGKGSRYEEQLAKLSEVEELLRDYEQTEDDNTLDRALRLLQQVNNELNLGYSV